MNFLTAYTAAEQRHYPNNTSPELRLLGENPPLDDTWRRRRDGVDGVGEFEVPLPPEFFRPLRPRDGLLLALLPLFLQTRYFGPRVHEVEHLFVLGVLQRTEGVVPLLSASVAVMKFRF